MAYTYTVHTGDGIKTVFDFQFAGDGYGYFRPSDVHVYVAQQEVAFSFVGTNQVKLVTAPPLGSAVMIRRIMPKDEPYAKWERGNNFNARNTNNSFLQQLYMVQELYDGFMTTGFRFNEDVSFGGFRVKDIANAVEGGDAVPLRQMKGWNDSALTSATRAEAARDRAVVAETGSKASELAAAESARQAALSRDSAAVDAITASASSGAAVQAANTATGAATQAQADAAAASASATSAAGSASASAASAVTSEYWSKLSQAAALPPGAVGSATLADGAVTNAKLADGAVAGAKIAALAIGEGHLGNNSVSSNKVRNLAIQARHLTADSVTTAAIAASAVTVDKVTDGAISKVKLAADVADVYLPKAGGALTGAISSDSAISTSATVSAGNVVVAGQNAVRSVNGVAADANGAVSIAVGGGGVPLDSWGAVGCFALVTVPSGSNTDVQPGSTWGNVQFAYITINGVLARSAINVGGTWRALCSGAAQGSGSSARAVVTAQRIA